MLSVLEAGSEVFVRGIRDEMEVVYTVSIRNNLGC
jgi:hypothetical protein